MFPIIRIFEGTVLEREIGTYALMAVIGAAFAFVLLWLLVRRTGRRFDDTILFLVFIAVGIFIGGSLLYGITNLYRFPLFFKVKSFGEFMQVFSLIFGGSVFYGGLIGAIFAGVLGTKVLKLSLAEYADYMAVIAPFFHAFARIGCFLGGCCYGIECEFGFTAHGNPLVPELNGVSRFPVQLLESGCNLLIFALMLTLLLKNKLRGRLFFVYLGTYAVVRFFDEFLRGDAIRGFIFGLSTSQFISILMEIAAISGLIISAYRKKKSASKDRDEALSA